MTDLVLPGPSAIYKNVNHTLALSVGKSASPTSANTNYLSPYSAKSHEWLSPSNASIYQKSPTNPNNQNDKAEDFKTASENELNQSSSKPKPLNFDLKSRGSFKSTDWLKSMMSGLSSPVSPPTSVEDEDRKPTTANEVLTELVNAGFTTNLLAPKFKDAKYFIEKIEDIKVSKSLFQ